MVFFFFFPQSLEKRLRPAPKATCRPQRPRLGVALRPPPPPAGPQSWGGGRGSILSSESWVPRRSPDLTPSWGPRRALTTTCSLPLPSPRPCGGLGPHSRGSRPWSQFPIAETLVSHLPYVRLSGPFRNPTPHPASPAFQAKQDTTPLAQPAAPF